ncbi:DUF1549 and DUF1553 domain-containing protein [Zavarzinella formosa]|uniref:DUF1549 and DUF1553 domain-containing protein n=1 Tax=Zavarzinella formosa TaxID=360055 RepID=UPI00030CD7F4|nr:DUF1549 and DUF1553 domain-containing protein [Zavarzinella formosa]
MWIRKTIATLSLTIAVGMIVSQASSNAADGDTKADKKKAKQLKLLEAKKKAEAEKPPEPANGGKAVVISKTPPAAPAKPMATEALAKMIDMGIDKPLKDAKIQVSSQSSDAEFLRRVCLDITGVVPTVERASAFLDDRSPDKRAKLINELLSAPEFGKHQSDIWTVMMNPIDSENRFVSKAPLREWLTEKFNANMHWDTMAYELMTATGDLDKNGATGYMMANRGVDKMTDSVGKLFLGVQIQCAQCHNHPFTHWKQTEYWGLAQFFYKVNVSNPRAAKDGGTITVNEDGRVNRKVNALPEAAKHVSAKYLGSDEVKLNSSEPYRPALAQWICTPSNPFFAKAFVNRIWSQYFGRGIVNPVDDLSDENVPTHPELLANLSKEFAASGFDIKHLIRGICNSQAYQRSSKPLGDNRDDKTMFSHQGIKVLTAEQLFDSLAAVLGVPGGGKDGGKAKMAPAPKGGPQGPRDQFALFFMGTETAKPTEYEAGIPQALRLMNSPLMANGRLLSAANRIAEVARPATTPDKAIEKLYLGTLSRRPSTDELKKMKDYVAKQTDPKQAYSDVMWVLLNSSEFTLNR